MNSPTSPPLSPCLSPMRSLSPLPSPLVPPLPPPSSPYLLTQLYTPDFSPVRVWDEDVLSEDEEIYCTPSTLRYRATHNPASVFPGVCVASTLESERTCAVILLLAKDFPDVTGYYPMCAYTRDDCSTLSPDGKSVLYSDETVTSLEADDASDRVRAVELLGFHLTFMSAHRVRLEDYSPYAHHTVRSIWTDIDISVGELLHDYDLRVRVYMRNRLHAPPAE